MSFSCIQHTQCIYANVKLVSVYTGGVKEPEERKKISFHQEKKKTNNLSLIVCTVFMGITIVHNSPRQWDNVQL